MFSARLSRHEEPKLLVVRVGRKPGIRRSNHTQRVTNSYKNTATIFAWLTHSILVSYAAAAAVSFRIESG